MAYFPMDKRICPENTSKGANSSRPSPVLKASVFAAVDEEVAKAMIGHQLPGTIKQLQVEPYQIVNDETGEVRVYNHRSEYVPDELMELA